MKKLFIKEEEIFYSAGNESRNSDIVLESILNKVEFVCKKDDGYIIDESFAGEILKSLLILKLVKILEFSKNKKPMILSEEEKKVDEQYLLSNYIYLLKNDIENKEPYNNLDESVQSIINKKEYNDLLNGKLLFSDFLNNKGYIYDDIE